jgi:hypothetical protein
MMVKRELMSVQKNTSEADLREAHTRSILLSPSCAQSGVELDPMSSGFQKLEQSTENWASDLAQHHLNKHGYFRWSLSP